MLAERTGLQQSNISRIFRLVYVPTIKTLDNLANAFGVEIVFRQPYEKLYDERYTEINELFRKHFQINIPKDCRSLKDVVALANNIHHKSPQWYMSFLASIMDIWAAYEEEPLND